MTKKKKNNFSRKFKKVFPYLATGAITLALVFVGSIDKKNASASLSIDSLGAENYKISVDQLSGLYMVADLSNTLHFASADDVASNYVVATTMYNIGQTTTGKLEKPSVTNLAVSRGVVKYEVGEGETMESIAKKFGVSTDQIRWSNGKKTTDVDAGDILYVPSVEGIVYTVKDDDTIASIVDKYGSSEEEIIALNDLEVSGISEGMRILIKGGTLPETERPEYVPPVRTYTYTYTYLGDTSTRTNLVCNRELGAGQCVTWALIKRPDLDIKGNANRWDDIARGMGVLVDNTPEAGAIFQTDSGWYGHVGYVESKNSDGSINVSERNYSGCYGVLFSTIPADAVGKFFYIH